MGKLIHKLSAGLFLFGLFVAPTLARSQDIINGNLPHANLTVETLTEEDPNESVKVIESEVVRLSTYSDQTLILSSRKNGAVIVEVTNSNLRFPIFEESSASFEVTQAKKTVYRIFNANWIFISDLNPDHSTMVEVPFKNIKFADGFECHSTHIVINGVDMCE